MGDLEESRELRQKEGCRFARSLPHSSDSSLVNTSTTLQQTELVLRETGPLAFLCSPLSWTLSS